MKKTIIYLLILIIIVYLLYVTKQNRNIENIYPTSLSNVTQSGNSTNIQNIFLNSQIGEQGILQSPSGNYIMYVNGNSIYIKNSNGIIVWDATSYIKVDIS